MRLDDFVMLGTTVPEPMSDGRDSVCSAGYSPEFKSLLRLYPLSMRFAPRRWHSYQVEVERNPRDSRIESFALRGERRVNHGEINRRNFKETGRIKPDSIADAVKLHSVQSIREANEKLLSLAFLQPRRLSLYFDHNPQAPDAPQLKLFAPEASTLKGSKRFPHIPRLRFLDQAGYNHDLKLRDWGAFEYLRKFPHDLAGLERNLRINDDAVLLVGNHAQHRSSWLVIAVLHVAIQPALFSLEAVAA